MRKIFRSLGVFAATPAVFALLIAGTIAVTAETARADTCADAGAMTAADGSCVFAPSTVITLTKYVLNPGYNPYDADPTNDNKWIRIVETYDNTPIVTGTYTAYAPGYGDPATYSLWTSALASSGLQSW